MSLLEEPSELLSLKGRTAVLTGGGRGLGRTMAQGLAAAGARLVLAGRNEAVLSKATRELNGEGGMVTWESVDLADRAATVQFADRVLSKFGRVDVLVHNAGQEGLQAVDQVTEKTMDAIFGTNFFSAVQMTRGVCGGYEAKRLGATCLRCIGHHHGVRYRGALGLHGEQVRARGLCADRRCGTRPLWDHSQLSIARYLSDRPGQGCAGVDG